MKKLLFRITSTLLVLLLLVSVWGCSAKHEEDAKGTKTDSATASASTAATTEVEPVAQAGVVWLYVENNCFHILSPDGQEESYPLDTVSKIVLEGVVLSTTSSNFAQLSKNETHLFWETFFQTPVKLTYTEETNTGFPLKIYTEPEGQWSDKLYVKVNEESLVFLDEEGNCYLSEMGALSGIIQLFKSNQ